ncbi:hypothetical protein [Natronoglycomyces albus]|uniref:Uncharacterized protein n=1 Tax=Natronoglycomyces albus TaxID=2811108 RepID=A0A895XQV5_9ACTN|nr:hypothetical protein [Natronoglycomyces albus]QSB03948.1 hypothetical protein JQS30_08930 [Natronoglycomyces albus]
MSASIEPGKHYGSFPNQAHMYHLYGSNHGDSLDIYRSDTRTGSPLGRAYLTPKGGWWIMWYVFGSAGDGLTDFHANLVEFTSKHPEF